MMLQTKRLTILMLLPFAMAVQAQGNYDFESFNEPYEDLVGGTSLNNGQAWDDPEFEIPLGFELKISTHQFDKLYIVGWSTGGVLSSHPVDSGILPGLAILAQDIIDLGYGGVSQSPLSYLTEGEPGARITKIEWSNVGFFDDMTASDFINFQLWVYEGSNIVEYRYGPSQINYPQNSYEGETGPWVNFFPSIDLTTIEGEPVEPGYVLTGDPSNPEAVEIMEESEIPENLLLGDIPNGMVYRFIPKDLSTSTPETTSITLFPNPVQDRLYLHTNRTPLSVMFLDVTGKHLYSLKSPTTMNTQSGMVTTLDVGSLSKGIYFLQIETIDGFASQKFIKK